jgi:hypothetical protein
MTRVYLEVGKTWTFACAIDHPGWQRRGKGELAALEALEDYRSRYGDAVGSAPEGELHVVGTVVGTMTTDFGAPDVAGPWDDEPLQPGEVVALDACWQALDRAVLEASAELRKGPRGGGRDRDQVVDHVREAERAYARKLGARVTPRTPWPEQRAAILAALPEASEQAWPVKYAVRRLAWHVLDHAWEIEDKSLT